MHLLHCYLCFFFSYSSSFLPLLFPFFPLLFFFLPLFFSFLPLLFSFLPSPFSSLSFAQKSFHPFSSSPTIPFYLSPLSFTSFSCSFSFFCTKIFPSLFFFSGYSILSFSFVFCFLLLLPLKKKKKKELLALYVFKM